MQVRTLPGRVLLAAQVPALPPRTMRAVCMQVQSPHTACCDSSPAYCLDDMMFTYLLAQGHAKVAYNGPASGVVGAGARAGGALARAGQS